MHPQGIRGTCASPSRSSKWTNPVTNYGLDSQLSFHLQPAFDLCRRRAVLKWDMACERVNNAVRPPIGRPSVTQEYVIDALDVMRKAIDALEQAYLTSGEPPSAPQVV